MAFNSGRDFLLTLAWRAEVTSTSACNRFAVRCMGRPTDAPKRVVLERVGHIDPGR
jgi:hypothetical protein